MTDDSVRPYRLRAPLVAIALGLAVIGCGTDSGTAESPQSGSGDGAALYQRSCASCHGADLRGTDRGPSHLSQVYEAGHHSDESFRAAIAQGSQAHHWDFGAMPALPDLDPRQVDAIIAFVRDQQDAHSLEPYPPS